MDENKPKTADWEPGTLDKTRRNIGNINEDEARIMSQKLGGQVMYEKSSHTSPVTSGNSRNTGRIIREPKGESNSRMSDNNTNSQTQSKGRRNQEELPEIPQRVANQLDKLMMSDEYGIKPNYGIFNFIKLFQNNGKEQLVNEFCSYTIKMHIENLQGFITVIKTLIQIAPASYKAKIANGTEAKFKFLRMVAGWTMQGIKMAHLDLMNLNPPYVVQDLIAYTRAIYRLLVQVYYYGDTKIPKLIKEIYADESAYPDSPKEQLSSYAKEAITQWLYIDNEIIKKLYPLLMRMCSNTFEAYPDFFKVKVADILKFVGLHKYDLLLQDKPKEAAKGQVQEQEKKRAVVTKGVKDAVVNTGINLLDQLFPQAGFRNLENHPDLYPYFQPLYRFGDGFNLVSPENPLHVTVVLVRIIEDFFQGCRNIKFTQESNDFEEKKGGDSITKVMDEWSNYRETVFERLYCEPLNELVNTLYTQPEFDTTQFGKKLISSLLWQVNYHYISNYKFDQLLLEHPADEAKVPPLFKRTDFARKYLTQIVTQCDAVSKTKGAVLAVNNPWEHYKFDIQNEVSKRLDVLLGANNKSENTNATNANLLKYTLCILAVLDWWVNNPDSPARATSPTHIYRVSAEDGKPQFSVSERSDQNKLFVEQIKNAYQKKSETK